MVEFRLISHLFFISQIFSHFPKYSSFLTYFLDYFSVISHYSVAFPQLASHFSVTFSIISHFSVTHLVISRLPSRLFPSYFSTRWHSLNNVVDCVAHLLWEQHDPVLSNDQLSRVEARESWLLGDDHDDEVTQ